MNRLVHISFLAVVLVPLLLAGCHKDGQDGIGADMPDASLAVRLCVPDTEVEMRSVSDSPTDPKNWSSWERVVDGRYLYRVTAFLLQGNRLVAVTDLDLGDEDEPAETTLSFDGNFIHGTYRLMIVANWSAHSADDGDEGMKEYSGLAGFGSTVQEILNTKGVIENFTSTYAGSFMNFMISSEDGICERVPQALSLVKDIELHPGENLVEGELMRTYARIRIAVENQSDEPLNVSSLEFGDLFTQTKAYLFPNVGYYSERTSPDVSAAEAMTPFTATGVDPLVIPGKSSDVIFDAYILESQRNSNEAGYEYSLGLGYEDTGSFTVAGTTAINDASEISKGYYMIYNARRQRFLASGGSMVSSVLQSDLDEWGDGAEIPEEYVWALDDSGLSGNQFYVGTPEILQPGDQTSYYMAQTGSSGVSLNSKFSSDCYFTFATYQSGRSDYLSIRASSASSGNGYLQVGSNGTVSGTSYTGNNTRFLLYPVAYSGASVHEIGLKTIDSGTGQAADVEEIRRNDFVNVLIAVSYSMNTGHFMFEVKDWASAGGDVSFN